MVASVTSFGRNGLSDWIIQRFTAVVLAAYTVFILGYLIYNPELTYEQWSGLFACTAMRIFSLLALLCIGAHAWVGLWTVSTDYMRSTAVRLSFQAFFGVVLFAYVVWGIQILWG
ncbi:succinate dehydrogenase [Oleiphilus sp. HI0009]|uniref:succinate dehydrogenase, hydrophobic membrane anchor protein n=1 Tax=unclassified Oleiphilus TaxID=2631174 RepID=UPI0007C2415F|nr:MULTISPECIES: succinate dehydrogenase, hydrophobic membrane anchor protein [unclassified Oleiphilus]KZX74953.1 succinate dehydrogenase [Oleiphilus sp. HI0009]MCH2159196.1 succinate dehydrogenase, hydrophobic membrane anchor protein [Oleiphilaceae bacterium]KZX85730.1 succinate dehydrogenase [Oleiphilus sp. HI0009]KZY68561.1 succinate dehydrogenase [Oleiphilus sp. HI0066]KZY69465.1 succinate dehydrogenase [Oleiphilus sp. HI0066]